ncbi:MAG: hypothetical protein ACLQMH_18490, partial [Solirubrobacteraceae bacterium]
AAPAAAAPAAAAPAAAATVAGAGAGAGEWVSAAADGSTSEPGGAVIGRRAGGALDGAGLCGAAAWGPADPATPADVDAGVGATGERSAESADGGLAPPGVSAEPATDWACGWARRPAFVCAAPLTAEAAGAIAAAAAALPAGTGGGAGVPAVTGGDAGVVPSAGTGGEAAVGGPAGALAALAAAPAGTATPPVAA